MKFNNKKCSKCKYFLSTEFFYKNKSKKDKLATLCKICSNQITLDWKRKNKTRVNFKQRERRHTYSKQYNEYQRKYRETHGYYSTLNAIKNRCNNPKHLTYSRYGGRGIKCLISLEEVKTLWFRDGAIYMKKPSINRINPDKNYTLDNCEFVEHSQNCKEGARRRCELL